METAEDRVMLLTENINKLSVNLDEDYNNLMDSGLSEDLLDNLLGATLMHEVEKLVLLFEVLNSDVFITGIQRTKDEEGNMIVNLDWEHNENN